jgi:hypothetical protein
LTVLRERASKNKKIPKNSARQKKQASQVEDKQRASAAAFLLSNFRRLRDCAAASVSCAIADARGQNDKQTSAPGTKARAAYHG